MARRLRVDLGGYAYHVINRRVGRERLFDGAGDYGAFEKVLTEAQDYQPMRLLAYCLMPNHWHLVVWPKQDGELSRFMQWLTVTHMRRWHAHHDTVGSGPLYQGRFRSFPIQEDDHLLTVCRYVERNALRAGKVDRAEEWRWSSLYRRRHGSLPGLVAQDRWPVAVGADWLRFVNRAETDAELEAMRQSSRRGAPYGDAEWRYLTATKLGLESALRDPWRPKKAKSREFPRLPSQ